jgi:tRNA/rRNA methyltransferase
MKTPIIILVRPQMGENIGAAARAMMNFGLKDLRLVAPRDGWPNPKAHEMSAHAEHIIEQTKVFDTLADALADCQIALAASARRRDMEIRYYFPETAAQAFAEQNIISAYVFGPENNGLSNEDVALCNGVVTIPTHPDNKSLNIAQSVGVLAYTWFRAMQGEQKPVEVGEDVELAAQDSLHKLYDYLDGELDARGFYKTENLKPKMQTNLRALLGRMIITKQEVQTLWGVIATLTRNQNQSK